MQDDWLLPYAEFKKSREHFQFKKSCLWILCLDASFIGYWQYLTILQSIFNAYVYLNSDLRLYLFRKDFCSCYDEVISMLTSIFFQSGVIYTPIEYRIVLISDICRATLYGSLGQKHHMPFSCSISNFSYSHASIATNMDNAERKLSYIGILLAVYRTALIPSIHGFRLVRHNLKYLVWVLSFDVLDRIDSRKTEEWIS